MRRSPPLGHDDSRQVCSGASWGLQDCLLSAGAVSVAQRTCTPPAMYPGWAVGSLRVQEQCRAGCGNTVKSTALSGRSEKGEWISLLSVFASGGSSVLPLTFSVAATGFESRGSRVPTTKTNGNWRSAHDLRYYETGYRHARTASQGMTETEEWASIPTPTNKPVASSRCRDI